MPATMVNSAKPPQAPSSMTRRDPVELGHVGLAAGQRVDDPAEQDRLREQRRRQRQVGDPQNPAETGFLAQHG